MSKYNDDLERIRELPQKKLYLCECGYWVYTGNLVEPTLTEGERVLHDHTVDHFQVTPIYKSKVTQRAS